MAGVEVTALQFHLKSYKHHKVSGRRVDCEYCKSFPRISHKIEREVILGTVKLLQELSIKV